MIQHFINKLHLFIFTAIVTFISRVERDEMNTLPLTRASCHAQVIDGVAREALPWFPYEAIARNPHHPQGRNSFFSLAVWHGESLMHHPPLTAHGKRKHSTFVTYQRQRRQASHLESHALLKLHEGSFVERLRSEIRTHPTMSDLRTSRTRALELAPWGGSRIAELAYILAESPSALTL